MAPVGEAIELFEGKARRILWLPPITLGYIFTLSGVWHHFALAAGSIGGAKLFSDIAKSGMLTDEGGKFGGFETGEEVVQERFSNLDIWRMFVLVVVYFSAMALGWIELYAFFDHTNPILVAISGIYWGGLLVVILKP